MGQSTTNLGKIHVFPSEALYNQFKNLVADNDLALLKDDGAYIVAALLEQNGYVKFSNGLILQWGNAEYTDNNTTVYLPIAYSSSNYIVIANCYGNMSMSRYWPFIRSRDNSSFVYLGTDYSGSGRPQNVSWISIGC